MSTPAPAWHFTLAHRLAPIAASLAGLALLALAAAAGTGATRPLAAQELPAVGEIQVAARAPQAAQRQVLVELADPPAAVVWAAALADRGVSRQQAKQNAVAAAHSQMARLAAAQESLAGRLAGAPFHGHEIYRIRRALNAIALFVDADRLAELRRLPGVKAVHILVPEVPLNATSVPFIKAPQLWANTLGLPANITGAGVTIGIIDTGIDYQHPMLGGSGLLADYQANDRRRRYRTLTETSTDMPGTRRWLGSWP
jgi:subtilisin family serine protease